MIEQNFAFGQITQFSTSSTSMIIKNERSKRAILASLADLELQKILDATMYSSKSITQIIRDTGIPHTNV